MWLQALLLGLLAMEASAQAPPGFISIDCGLETNDSYRNQYNNLVYDTDASYIDTGVNQDVSPDTNLTGLHRYYSTLRSFPDGTRNCYTLGPVRKGGRYLVRAEFEYGNYDGRNAPPTFDVYLGVNLWQTVPPEDFSRLEIIAIAPSESIQVCLVAIGMGTPFISSLELRPLRDTMYTMANKTHSLVLYEDREDHGRNGSMRYPNDMFDRVWFGSSKRIGTPVSTDNDVLVEEGDLAMAPPLVFETAVKTNSTSQFLNFTVKGISGEKMLVFLYFAEIENIKGKQRREFSVYRNGNLISGPHNPKFLVGQTVIIPESGPGGTSNYTIQATANSTLPPIINGREVYKLVELKSLPTDEGDDQRSYGVKRNWIGDPCVPRTGIISPSIANLTDLSGNNLTGEIPTDLAELLQLKVLNLENNQLSGVVPKILHEKSQNQTLQLRIDGNTNLCREGSCEARRKNKIIVPITVGIAASSVLVFLIAILISWRIRRRKKISFKVPQKVSDIQSNKQQGSLNLESSQFTFAEIVIITENFQHQIGEGGFGKVYRGRLRNGIEVAVKLLSKASFQGEKEFQAEAQILTRVHHRNLVSFLGYCNEPDSFALVYEFMAHGNLAMHLSDKLNNDLSWSRRLRIAIEVAQGLEYLHIFCKPPIVHRDVKTANILLNLNLEAKLADFGMSKFFRDENSVYISTAIVGTPGYLDPEYCQTSKLTEKSDVYSFGIVLLELITGKPPITRGLEKSSTISWVQSNIQRGDITEIVDKRLGGKYDTNSIWKALEVALLCTMPNSTQRPSMSAVVTQLKDCLPYMTPQYTSSDFHDCEQSRVDVVPFISDIDTNPSAR
ncbi:unnamed protein product [Spirodela intermedia]|uniref:non-specific serine/threonine protein kinase n=1 Tax=Spirodela intermedia TaxID=51605 RepID=A0A7I8JTA3_SPIIN|nr:unnamed protein product [Spirodela intermedia]CAA6672843.1 unnamed protein product [Spirodela intermedia]